MHFPSLALIIPCFNEAGRIHDLFSELDQFQNEWKGEWQVYLVDDGSTDRTLDVITEQLKNCTYVHRIHIIQQANTGKGGALKRGVTEAEGDFFLTLDADMATSPRQVIHWLENRKVFRSGEVFIGSRELQQSDVQDRWLRKLAGHVFNFCIRTLTSLPYRDTQCGFKLYPSGAAKSLFASLQNTGWAHDVELLLAARKAGYKVVEMPVHWMAREGSKINVWKHSFTMLWDVIRIRWRYRKKR